MGLRHARRALELDPDLALAWSALADCHAFRAIRGMAPPAEAVAEATAAAHQGAGAGSVARRSARVARRDPVALRRPRRRAARASSARSSSTPASRSRTTCSAARSTRYERHAEALAAMHKAVSLDPLSMMHPHRRRATRTTSRASTRSRCSTTGWRSSSIRASTARTPTSRARSRRWAASTRRAPSTRRGGGSRAGSRVRRSGWRTSRRPAGNTAEARRILAELTEARSRRVVSAWGIAALHASLGDVDEAFRWLEIAIEERAAGMILLRVHPRLDPIRKDPRYAALVRRVGLESGAESRP